METGVRGDRRGEHEQRDQAPYALLVRRRELRERRCIGGGHEAAFLADRVLVFGTRPGRLKQEFAVPFQRPRALALKRQPEFLALIDGIWSLIEEEGARAGLVRTSKGAEAPA